MSWQYRFRFSEMEGGKLLVPLGYAIRPDSALGLLLSWGMHEYRERPWRTGEIVHCYRQLWDQPVGPGFPPPADAAVLRTRINQLWEKNHLERKKEWSPVGAEMDWHRRDGAVVKAAPAQGPAASTGEYSSCEEEMKSWVREQGFVGVLSDEQVAAYLAKEKEVKKKWRQLPG